MRTPERVAELTSRQVTSVQARLGELAASAELAQVLAGAGGEASPEEAFTAARRMASELPIRVDSLVVVNERGRPVAWTGPSPRLPLRLRPLGDRMAVAETGVGETWLWWREAVFDSGRAVGGVLAAARMPAGGARRVLGVWAGRAAVAAPEPVGAGVVLASGSALLRVGVRPATPVAGSQPGWAGVLALVVVACSLGSGLRLAAVAASLPAMLLLGWLGPAWWLVAVLAGLALGVSWSWARRVPAVVPGLALGGLTWVLPGLLVALDVAPGPDTLLWPGALRWALILSMVVLLRAMGRAGTGLPLPLRLLAWVPLVVGVAQSEPWLVAPGVVLAVWPGGAGRRLLLSAALAGCVVMTSDEVARRQELVTVVDTTLARLDGAASTARSVLARLAEEKLVGMARQDVGERLVILGQEVVAAGLARELPGVAVEVLEPSGVPAAVWGDATWPDEGDPRELAGRALAHGWRVRITRPPEPHDLLAGLTEAGLDLPVAVFDRAGSPVGRGATFRPLSPARVGAALAAGRSWGKVGVGERVLPSYLRARGEGVVAAPWVRLPITGRALQVAALVLWGALPLGAWQGRRRWRRWWQQRATFLGRLRVLLAATTVLPVLLLAQVLPAQWARQHERAQMELGRAVSRSLATPGREERMAWLVREMGGTLAIFRSGALVSSTRPDLAALGRVPLLPPAEAFTRAVRGWREPVVQSGSTTSVFAPLQAAGEPVVVAALELRVSGLSGRPTPMEWFVITGVLALGAALLTADRLGRRLARPLRRLVGAARRLEHGQEVPPLRPGSDEDLGALGRAFTTMAAGVKRREEELRGERDLRERVLDTLSAAVAVVDGEGRVALANPAARRLLGEAPDTRGLDPFLSAPLGELTRRLEAGSVIEEVVQPRSRPEARWRSTLVPLAGSAGRVLVVLEDLSEVARAERLSSLAELARIAAHEVKNPLTPIRLWAEELQAAIGRGPDQVVAIAGVAAGQILERVEHLREVAQGFGNLVALEQWEPSVFDLVVVARKVVDEYRVLPSRGIALGVRGEAGLVRADVRWVERALRHLLENSVRVLGTGGGTVTLSVDSDDREVVLTVRDSGGGVPPEQLGRLFEPHFSTTSEGSGMGLAVVARVLARAGGSAEARNGAEGLEVRLQFPHP
jgi:signal transduction histidine kinase